MAQWEYIGISVALFFIISIGITLLVIHRIAVTSFAKNILTHSAWLGLWIPSFFVSFELVLLIPSAWLGYCLVQYERRIMKIKAAQVASA